MSCIVSNSQETRGRAQERTAEAMEKPTPITEATAEAEFQRLEIAYSVEMVDGTKFHTVKDGSGQNVCKWSKWFGKGGVIPGKSQQKLREEFQTYRDAFPAGIKAPKKAQQMPLLPVLAVEVLTPEYWAAVTAEQRQEAAKAIVDGGKLALDRDRSKLRATARDALQALGIKPPKELQEPE